MAVAIRLEGNTLILDDNGTVSSVDLTALKGEKGDMGVRGAQGACGDPSVKFEDLTEEQKAEIGNILNAIEVNATETESGITFDTPVEDILAAYCEEGKKVICKLWAEDPLGEKYCRATLPLTEAVRGWGAYFSSIAATDATSSSTSLTYISYTYGGITSGTKQIAVEPSPLYSNALIGHKSGAVVACDVSPIEHTMRVKARVKNLFPVVAKSSSYPNGSTITVNSDGTLTIHKVAGDRIYAARTVYLEGGTYTLSNGLNAGSKALVSVGGFGSTGAVGSISGKLTSGEHILSVLCDTSVVLEEDVTLYPQLELSSTATPYTPYIADVSTANVIVNGSQTYPINADGTVEGVSSLYPTTTLLADTEGIVLDVEYNRDINRALATATTTAE